MTYDLTLAEGDGSVSRVPVFVEARALSTAALRRIYVEKRDHITAPRPVLSSAASHEFGKHKTKWKRDTKFLSSPLDRYMHPSYQRIIGLGPAVTSLILRDLKKELNDWFFALPAITGE